MLLFSQAGAGLAAKIGLNVDSTAPSLLAKNFTAVNMESCGATTGADRPGSPGSHLAIDGARASIAWSRIFKCRASNATMRWVSGNQARARFVAAAARCRASRRLTPITNIAVDWAWLLVATTVFAEVRADLAGRIAGNFLTSAFLETFTAALGALAPW